MKTLSILILGFAVIGCATSGTISRVKIGMTRGEVVEIMGNPVSVSAISSTEYLNYKLSETDGDAFYGLTAPYFVRLINGKVESYGRSGDFGSPKTPTVKIETYVTPVFADENEPLLDKSMFSIGAGISNNSVSRSSDKTGFQFFAAYDLNQVNLMEGVKNSVEFGFIDYGFSSDSTGIWATYMVDGTISEQFGWLARLGLDIGDDSGLIVGAGVRYTANEKMELRGEYVVRDEVDSLQFNFLYHP